MFPKKKTNTKLDKLAVVPAIGHEVHCIQLMSSPTATEPFE